jgi:hypothetical protein
MSESIPLGPLAKSVAVLGIRGELSAPRTQTKKLPGSELPVTRPETAFGCGKP